MQHHRMDSDPVSATTLVAWARSADRFSFSAAALERLAADRKVVQAHAVSGDPVYGLNTGLGGNLGYRLGAHEVVAFQQQIILGRMVGMGEPLPHDVVRAALLARAISLAKGGSGVSVAAAVGMLALVDRGVTPVVPMLGSIGAGDLGLCAHMVAPVIGWGEAFYQGRRYSGAQALAAAGLTPVALQAKDGLGLINASPLTSGYASVMACALSESLLVGAAVAALADEGYAANLSVFDPRIAAARPAGAQAGVAALFRALLAGSSLYDGKPRSIQDALSFRAIAPVFGAGYAALATLMDAVEVEINGNSDSPLVFAAEGDILSSPNFHPAMLALAFDSMAIAVTHLASASVQRVIKLQTAHLSGLPNYLSPAGGASVGFNALQKTAAAIHAEIKLKAMPASLDAVVVSDTVEDHATHAILCVRKLGEQLQLYRYLVAIEALVAAQAVDLRQSKKLGAGTRLVFDALRSAVTMLQRDRPPGPDTMDVHAVLFAGELQRAIRSAIEGGMVGCGLP